MRRLVSWVLLLTATWCTMPAWTQAGAPETLKTIWTTCVDEEATGYATFQSHNQKVVSNRRGYFMAYLRSRNEEYTAQQWRLIWSQDGGQNWRILCEETNATNPAVLETDGADNIYLVRPDWGDANWSSNKSYLYRFLSSHAQIKGVSTNQRGQQIKGVRPLCFGPDRTRCAITLTAIPAVWGMSTNSVTGAC